MSNMVPMIRFRGFTDDWEERKLTDILSRLSKSSNNSELPKIEFEDIIAGEGRLNKDVSHKFDDRKGILFESQNILYGKLRPYLKNWLLADFKGIALGDFWVFKSINSDPKFVYSLIQSNHYQKVANDTSGTKMPRSDWKKVSSTDFPTPSSLEEQQKIGSFFKQLDNTIALHQRILDLLKKQKKGFLQKMFPKNGAKVPELRFEGFTDDWEERKLGDTETHFTDGNYGESYPSAKDMSDKANGIPFLRGSDFSNGYLDSSNANYIKPEKHAELTSGHIKQDDIVLAVRGSLGTLGYATQENEGWNINSQLAILRTKKSEISGMFLIQYLLGSKGQKEIFSRNTGTALKQLPIKQLKDIPVPVPTLLEQQKIGNFFKELDSTIALHQRKLDLLKEQKKGFLQKMFV